MLKNQDTIKERVELKKNQISILEIKKSLKYSTDGLSSRLGTRSKNWKAVWENYLEYSIER